MVSVIIVNYNSANFILKCCNSLFQFEEIGSYEIVIVDNGSCDVEILREFVGLHSSMNISLIENTINYGFGKACNIGFCNSTGNFLFFLNPDTYLTGPVFNRFIKFFLENENHKIACLSSQLKHPDNSACHSYGRFLWPLYWNLTNNRRQNISLKGSAELVDVCVGSNMFLNRSTFDKINGFDHNIFLYQEELEMQYRLRIMGYDSFVIGDLGIIHEKGVSSSNLFQRQSMVISDAYIIRKHCNFIVYIFFRVYTISMALIFLKNKSIKMTEKFLYLKSAIYLKYF
jgi:GT2 family glycosyltransferase